MRMSGMPDSPKILIIRRDNIGDLVCTTPLFSALRQRFPTGRVCALVNSYNRPVLNHNPDVDRVYWYSKAKHQHGLANKVRSYWRRLRLLTDLWKEQFDYAILATPTFQDHALRFARLAHAKKIIGYADPSGRGSRYIDVPIPNPGVPMHEVELVHRLLASFDISGEPGPAKVVADPGATEALKSALRATGWKDGPTIGIHISARKPSQRWSAGNFVQLVHMLHQSGTAKSFLLFWAPGAADDPMHPGDDAKAADILRNTAGARAFPCKTRRLEELIAGLALCDYVICSDGGAMHLAAGLGKPVLCFFGKSTLSRWHPWGVPYIALQPATEVVGDISVTDAFAGFEQLRQRVAAASGPGQTAAE